MGGEEHLLQFSSQHEETDHFGVTYRGLEKQTLAWHTTYTS
jgi:hypothetical protein